MSNTDHMRKLLPEGYSNTAAMLQQSFVARLDKAYEIFAWDNLEQGNIYKTFHQGNWTHAQWLREFRTIRLGGPRQTGKTNWAVKKMRENQGTIIVSRDKAERDAVIGMASVGRTANKTITLTLDVADKDPMATVMGVMSEFMAANQIRVFTYKDLETLAETDLARLKTFNRVIIDDASTNTKLRDIYEILGKIENIEMEVVALG